MSARDVMRKLQDMTHLAWDERTVATGTGGTFLKSRARNSRGDIYYKLSCYDRYRGIYGHESANELVASRLLDFLHLDHVPYRLLHARIIVDDVPHETWMSESRDYRPAGQRRLALNTFYELNARPGLSPLDFCVEQGWSDIIFQMMAFDFLIANRDRHGANIEVSFDTDGRPGLSPLFDHGVSFVYSCYEDESRVNAFDPLHDVQANNYIGTRSLEQNLNFLPRHVLTGNLTAPVLDSLFAGLEEVLPRAHRQKMREIIVARWQTLCRRGIAAER